MKSLKIEFGFGVGFDKEHNSIQRDKSLAALTVIKREAAAIFTAYTLVQVYGGWTDPHGKLIEERGYTLSTVQAHYAPHDHSEPYASQITEMVETIKKALNQKCVAVTTSPVNFTLR